MYWLDLAIIYFALGAPFGVLRVTAKREITAFAYLRMTSGYLLWPLVAVRNVARFFTTKPVAQVEQTNKFDAIRTELEQALFASGNTFSESPATRRDLYNFREVFYRYTGLAAAIAEFRMQNAESDRFHSSFIIHHSSFVRSACIRRRDRQKLDMQFRAARQDFAEMLGATTTTKIDRTVEALAECTGDSALINAIYSR